MAQKKLLRFAAIKGFSNVLENPENMRGNWAEFFKNNHPIVVELACGRGEYTVGLSKLHPSKNFIGIDIKGNRMYIGAKICLENKIDNAAFLRTQIEKLTNYFDPGEVDEIWITFPDPQLRTSKAKKRLTHPKFLRLYQNIIKPRGFINLKTDSPGLYDFTRRVIGLNEIDLIEDSQNAYLDFPGREDLQIKTHYEKLDIASSNKIHYLKFSLPDAPLTDKDDALMEILKNEEQPG